MSQKDQGFKLRPPVVDGVPTDQSSAHMKDFPSPHQLYITSLYIPHLAFTSMHLSTAPIQVSSSTQVPHGTSSPHTYSSPSNTHPLRFHMPSLSSSPTEDPSHAHTFCRMHASPLTDSLSMILSLFFSWNVWMFCLNSTTLTWIGQPSPW